MLILALLDPLLLFIVVIICILTIFHAKHVPVHACDEVLEVVISSAGPVRDVLTRCRYRRVLLVSDPFAVTTRAAATTAATTLAIVIVEVAICFFV